MSRTRSEFIANLVCAHSDPFAIITRTAEHKPDSRSLSSSEFSRSTREEDHLTVYHRSTIRITTVRASLRRLTALALFRLISSSKEVRRHPDHSRAPEAILSLSLKLSANQLFSFDHHHSGSRWRVCLHFHIIYAAWCQFVPEFHPTRTVDRGQDEWPTEKNHKGDAATDARACTGHTRRAGRTERQILSCGSRRS